MHQLFPSSSRSGVISSNVKGGTPPSQGIHDLLSKHADDAFNIDTYVSPYVNDYTQHRYFTRLCETLTYMSYSLTRLLSHTVTKFAQESQLTYVCESILSISLERHSHPGMHKVQVFMSLL